MIKHSFTENIDIILSRHFGDLGQSIFKESYLIQYLNSKTRSASRGSKSRGSFANLYAIYVLVEDYIENGYHENNDYQTSNGAVYGKLFKRQRELPFGANLQNHALNNRLNAEFENTFPNTAVVPIIRMPDSERYWINENLLKISVEDRQLNLAIAVKEIIDDYITTKQDSFSRFIGTCQRLLSLEGEDSQEVENFINSQLAYNVDARLFEIVSYSILKYLYQDQTIFWGYKIEDITQENLKLFKTGRTNANDGGIDFVMRPLGRFFQVTETLDFKKYFLDIDKLQRYPITFVIKAEDDVATLFYKIKADALKTYAVTAVVDRYLSCVEEIINIPLLKKYLKEVISAGHLNSVLNEIISQSKLEFNYNEESISLNDEENTIEDD